MSELDDHDLLAQYAQKNSEAAFAALAERHLGLVYSTALRCAGHAYAAEEISQAVFIILAQKADKLSRKVALSGWLYQTTRLTAANFLRSEIRRQKREQEAFMQSLTNDAETWRHIAPLLDDALGKLSGQDRDAIVLRFFENKNLREVGLAMGASEDAAKMRVNRALEKLRKFFGKRGAAFSTAAIAGAVSANSVHAAPAGLTKIISAVAMTKGAFATVSTLTLVKGTLTAMSWANMKKAIIIGAVLVVAGGTTTLLAQHQHPSNPPGSGLYYDMLDDACQFVDSVDQTKLVLRVAITSLNKSVPQSDIHVMIQSAVKGAVPLQLSPDGQVLNFPHDEALRRENPLITHQSKGKLNLTIIIKLPMPESLTFHYRLLSDGVAEANKAIGKAGEIIQTSYPEFVPKIPVQKLQDVIFYFPGSSAGKATVVILSAAGPKEYTADAKGQIKLKLDETLLTENPEIMVSERPQNVIPDWWD